jgi:hypothetical protein
MKDQYVILRFLAFFLLKAEGLPFHYKSNIDDLLAETMKCINQMQKEEIKRLQVIFKKSMHASFQIMGPDAFRTPSVDYRFEAVKSIAMELTC